MKILMVAAEVTPLIKVGGLADVVGALPTALVKAGHETRILIPRYGLLVDHGFGDEPTGIKATVPWKNQSVEVELYRGQLPGSDIIIYTLAANALFDGGAYVSEPSPAGYQRQMERFVFFSWAAVHLLKKIDWQPDIIHCHDWHTAGITVFSKILHHPVPSVLTIHNIESQGKWRATEIFSWLGLRGNELPSFTARDPMGDFNVLQQAVLHASAVTTVSPTYAQEILQPEFGLGLEHDLKTRPGGVIGIVNGIDVVRNDPATDSHIVAHYSADTVREGKNTNRAALTKLYAWPEAERPVLGMVSRLTPQKGVNLLVEALPYWVLGGGRVVILGAGQSGLEQQLVAVANKYPEAMHVQIGFDATLAQQIYAGSDFFAMPSKFEPCGLGQLVAMRYGSLPIVRDTGGLHDTVIDFGQRPDDGTGIVFKNFTPMGLQEALAAALQLWQKADILQAARQRAMRQDFSWTSSAAAYIRVYANIKNR